MNDRFAALASALAAAPTGTARLAVGFSGGLDSTALLHALRRHGPSLPLRAIHVCHHLQPAAEDWAARCRARCADWAVDFCRLDVTVERRGHGLEAAARAARYHAVEAVLEPDETLVTAHHRDDQAETFLLQALRGAGVAGLAAMPLVTTLGANQHWRPWLALERAEIRAYAEDCLSDWIEDPSNHDPDIARSYLRAKVMPVLQARWPAAARTLSRAAAHAAEADTALRELAQIDLATVQTPEQSLDCRRMAALSPARRKHLVRAWLQQAGFDRPDHRHIQALLTLPQARLASSPCVAFGNTEVRLFDQHLFCMPQLAPTPDRRLVLDWNGQGVLALPAGCGTLALSTAPARALSLQVTFRAGGERLPRADGHHRALKDELREQRVAPWVRERMPLIYCEGRLVAVADRWQHPDFAQLVGADVGPLLWRHGLLGGTLRVVGAYPLG